MGDAVAKLKTDSSLLEALEKASAAKPSPEELLEQRVSFIFGSLKAESDITHEQIKQLLIEQEGRPVRT
jgi:SpoU rRNA methylase family enzyme